MRTMFLITIMLTFGVLFPAKGSAQSVPLNAQAVANRISELQEQLRQEQQAALKDDATFRQFLQQQAAMARLPNSGAAAIAQLDSALAQNAANSASAHRVRAQQLQNEINGLNQQVLPMNSGTTFRAADPSGSPNFSLGSPAAVWSESFFGGALTLSPGRVRYDDRDRHGNLRKDSFDASCSELKEWKPNKMNFMNAFAGPNPQSWDFHIKLRGGTNVDFPTSTEFEMNNILQAISKACGGN